jgi:hypothetical protein
MSDVPRVVWILGSGFSVPLGGPMLIDLLSLKNLRRLTARFKDLMLEDGKLRTDIVAVYTLYHYGRRFPEGSVLRRGRTVANGELLWNDAEDFLDHLDVASRPDRIDIAAHVNEILARCHGLMTQGTSVAPGTLRLPDLGGIRTAARRLVAAECCLLEQPGAVDTERWGPYRRWAENLRKVATTVVTFNYDRVVESVVPHGWVACKEYVTGWSKQPCVLKLHGSVDWKLDQTRRTVRHQNGLIQVQFVEGRPDEALHCSDRELCIATPGPTKTTSTDSEGVLGPLWITAEGALRSAEAIVFVGYRFPPSDAHARTTLLTAILESGQKHVDIHIVLGPNRNADVVRLEHLLRYVMDRAGRTDLDNIGRGGGETSYRLWWHPLWAEDFLSIYDPKALSLPPRGDIR